MNQSQRELRYAASKAFIESLNQLKNNLQSPESSMDTEADPNAHTLDQAIEGFKTDPEKAWEDAAADIDRFMQQRQLDT